MGYYSVLNFELDNAFINKTKEQELKKEIKDNCNTGFDEVELIIDEDGKLTDIYFDDYDRKFYDDEIFANILSKYLIYGAVHLYFTGEDGEKWKYTIYPNLVIEGEIHKEENIECLLEEFKKGNISDTVKNNILNEIKSYWERQVKAGQKILEKITNFEYGKNYQVVVPAEEKRKVACNYIKYCDTKENAEELVDYIKNEGLVGVDFDVYEDIDVIDSWDTECETREITIEEI